MAVYKIFSEKDAAIYSDAPTQNTGRDEILDISSFNALNVPGLGEDIQVARALVQFPSSEINDLISNNVTGSYKAYLKLFLANGSSVPTNYGIYAYPISGSWNMGTGRRSDSPITTNGVSWRYRDSANSATTWNFSPIAFYDNNPKASGSVTSQYGTVPGGGNWYVALILSGSGTYIRPEASQSFTYTTNKDLNIDVTQTVDLWYSGTIANNGFILKQTSSIEFSTSSFFSTAYFSMDTHTIYPPQLEIKWDDSSYVTGSFSILTNGNFVSTLSNNKGLYNMDSKQRFRVYNRDQFPARTFTTSSVYLNNKYLPTSSYWSIVDNKTNEVVIDFDTNYTKISADTTSNYFDVYMNGLEPERYYKILIKSVLNNTETVVIDNENYFKIVK